MTDTVAWQSMLNQVREERDVLAAELAAMSKQFESTLFELNTANDTLDRLRKSKICRECVAVVATAPVSTLCAICDQIKELHPASHPWTAKETKRKCPECVYDVRNPFVCERCGTPRGPTVAETPVESEGLQSGWTMCGQCGTQWIVSDGVVLPCPKCSEANRGGVK